MMEVGVVLDLAGEPLHWHMPPGRSVVSLPDSKSLWDVLWENRDRVSGFAHSHPGRGLPGPSYEDVTTFAAIEAALGRRLEWYITSEDTLSKVCWIGPGKLQYLTMAAALYDRAWVEGLRQRSEYPKRDLGPYADRVEADALAMVLSTTPEEGEPMVVTCLKGRDGKDVEDHGSK